MIFAVSLSSTVKDRLTVLLSGAVWLIISMQIPSFETISTYIQKIVAKHPIPAEVRALSTIIFVVVLSVVVGITVYNNKKAAKVIKYRRR